MSTWLASPRMWPIGYLVGSPYSPFHLELQIPERNWRDAFEDLLALENGGQMTSKESRRREAEVAARLHYEKAHYIISLSNEQLVRDAKYMSVLQRMRAFAARNKMVKLIATIDDELGPPHKARVEETIKACRRVTEIIENQENRD